MVYTGKPSNGCSVCRKLRIKCDEKRPHCSHCIWTGQNCPGYKHEFDLAWRDQTIAARNSVQRQKKKYEAQAVLAVSRQSRPQAQSRELRQSHDNSLPMILPERPEHHYLSFLFGFYANPPPNTETTRGFLDYLSPLYKMVESGSTLYSCTMAVSALLFTAWQNGDPNHAIARTYYSQAIISLKSVIATNTSHIGDDILMSVLLLQMYEKLAGFQEKKSAPPPAHLEGALALIKHRGFSNFSGPISKGLLLSVRAQVIQEAFRKLSPCDTETEQWGFVCNDIAQTPTFWLDGINVHLARLQASVQNPGIPKCTETHELLTQARAVEQMLLDWTNCLPASWRYTSVDVNGIPLSVKRAGLYQSYCSVYTTISAVSGWNKYRVSMMKLQKIILTLAMDNTDTHYSSKILIQSLADDICGSVPFILGSRTDPGPMGNFNDQYPCLPGESVPEQHYWTAPAVGGFNLIDGFGGPRPLSPLGEVLFTEGLRDGQREWVGGQLKRIARIYRLGG